jgi:hypothetical protein
VIISLNSVNGLAFVIRTQFVSSVKNPRARTSVSRCLQPPAHPGSSLADFSTLKMEAIGFSETSFHTWSTRLHIQKVGIVHSHRCVNLKSYIRNKTFRKQNAVLNEMFKLSIIAYQGITANRWGHLPETRRRICISKCNQDRQRARNLNIAGTNSTTSRVKICDK